MVQQLQYDTAAYGGFFLKEPKGGSASTTSFDKEVQRAVENHLVLFGTREVELVDVTAQPARRRTARLLFTDVKGGRFTIGAGSSTRCGGGRPPAGRHGTFHALRHFCATTLLANGVDPQHAQKMLRHASRQFTLSTYAHWLPNGCRL